MPQLVTQRRAVTWVVDPLRMLQGAKHPIREVYPAPNAGGGDPGEDKVGDGTSFVRVRVYKEAGRIKWEQRLSRFAMLRQCFFLESAYKRDGELGEENWEGWLEFQRRAKRGLAPRKEIKLKGPDGKMIRRSPIIPFPVENYPSVVQRIIAGKVSNEELREMKFPPPIPLDRGDAAAVEALQRYNEAPTEEQSMAELEGAFQGT